MAEKREFPRIRIALPLRYETIRWSDPMRKIADARTATSRNISARGIALLYGPDIGLDLFLGPGECAFVSGGLPSARSIKNCP